MCSFQFCAPVLFLLRKKFTAYCLKSVPMCSVIWAKRTIFPCAILDHRTQLYNYPHLSTNCFTST